MSADTRNQDQASNEAADWFAAMHSGDVSRRMRREFEDWLHSDRANKLAYRDLEQVYRDLDFVAVEAGLDFSGASKLELHLRSWRSKAEAWLKKPMIGGGLAVACVSVFAFYLQADRASPVADASIEATAPQLFTEVAEIREVKLPDGSLVTLGAKSSIETEFTSTRRQVRLLEGEAFFDVATDAGRPFFVAAQDTIVRVVGTKFDVKRSADIVHIAVLEGVVEVGKADGSGELADLIDTRSTEKQVLTAGERVSAARRVALPKARQVDQIEPGSWRHGRLAYEDASLAEVVADLNRYHDHPIRISAPELGDIRSTVAFNASEIDQVLKAFEAIHPVKVSYLSSGEIVIRSSEED